MSISVKQLMRIGGLCECKVAAGHKGLDRLVKYVTVMEVPDIVKWLKGNELILTSLYAIKDDSEAQIQLIRQLRERGTAALAIKPHRFIGEIPQSMLREADACDFPVIEIPEKVSYLDILPPVSHAIFDQKVVLQEDLEQASQLLNEISLHEQGMEALIEALGKLTKNTITVESMLAYIEVPPPPFACTPLTQKQVHELSMMRRPIHMTRMCERQEMECIVAPILLDGHVYGNITCWAFDMEHLGMDLAILEKASALLALEFLRLKVRFDMQQQYKNEFLRELLVSEQLMAHDIGERGRMYGLTLDSSYLCFVAQVEGDEAKEKESPIAWSARIERAVSDLYPRALTGYLRQSVVCLCPLNDNSGTDEDVKKSAEVIVEQVNRQLGRKCSLKIGVGRSHGPGMSALRESFREAQQALLLGRMMKNLGQVIHYNDLGIYRLLGQMRDTAEMRRFYEETVAKLYAHDQTSDLQLVNTLRLYFQHDEKLTETAQALFLHVNTLKYRLRRIEKLTGFNLQQSEGRLMLHIGLKLADLLGDDYR